MKHSKLLSVWSLFVLVCLLFTACAKKTESPAPISRPPVSRNLSITVTNSSDYVFNELFVSPTASDEWGEDCLGSTNILKKNGSFEMSVPTYDFDNYDIMVVDEDDDTYLFKYIKLKTGTEVIISFGDGLVADIIHSDGTQEAVTGELYYADGETGGGGGGGAAAPANQTVTGTGYDTNGQYTFAVYNESDYDIYAIYIGIAGASEYDDIDLLPQVLPAGESIDLVGQASQGDWINKDWTLYVEDVDGDVSSTYDVFNPWLLSYVDIYWDNNSGGYVCEFYYE